MHPWEKTKGKAQEWAARAAASMHMKGTAERSRKYREWYRRKASKILAAVVGEIIRLGKTVDPKKLTELGITLKELDVMKKGDENYEKSARFFAFLNGLYKDESPELAAEIEGTTAGTGDNKQLDEDKAALEAEVASLKEKLEVDEREAERNDEAIIAEGADLARTVAGSLVYHQLRRELEDREHEDADDDDGQASIYSEEETKKFRKLAAEGNKDTSMLVPLLPQTKSEERPKTEAPEGYVA